MPRFWNASFESNALPASKGAGCRHAEGRARCATQAGAQEGLGQFDRIARQEGCPLAIGFQAVDGGVDARPRGGGQVRRINEVMVVGLEVAADDAQLCRQRRLPQRVGQGQVVMDENAAAARNQLAEIDLDGAGRVVHPLQLALEGVRGGCAENREHGGIVFERAQLADRVDVQRLVLTPDDHVRDAVQGFAEAGTTAGRNPRRLAQSAVQVDLAGAEVVLDAPTGHEIAGLFEADVGNLADALQQLDAQARKTAVRVADVLGLGVLVLGLEDQGGGLRQRRAGEQREQREQQAGRQRGRTTRAAGGHGWRFPGAEGRRFGRKARPAV